MRRFSVRLAAIVVAIVATFGLAQTAYADPGEPPDGRVWIYEGYHYGVMCNAFSGSPDELGFCHDKTSSLCNHGWPGGLDDVWVYQHTSYQGGKRGVYNGVCIADLRQYRFDGTNISMDNQISSILWTNLP